MGEPFISTFYPFTHLYSLVDLFWTLKNKRIGHVCVLAVKNTSLISICRSIFQAETTENSFVLLRFTGTERPETGHPKVPEFLLWEFSERIIFSFFCLFRSDSCYRDWVFGQLRELNRQQLFSQSLYCSLLIYLKCRLWWDQSSWSREKFWLRWQELHM